jgi:hypothetical protein
MIRTTTRSRACAVAVALCAAVGTAARAQHEGDVYLGVEDGAIVTGLWTGADDPEVPRFVFGGTFGDSGTPGFTSNPGFDAPPGTFDPATRVGFNVLDAVKVWNGAEFVETGGETFTIRFFTLEVTTGEGFTPGFDLSVQSNGGWHRHLSYFVNPEPGEGAADPGAYLLALEMYSTDAAVAPSEPFWIVFNHEEPVEVWTDAIAWAEANLVALPCPADLDGDGAIGFPDLLTVLAAWGACPEPPAPCADVDGDASVGFPDLLAVLAGWGPCAP